LEKHGIDYEGCVGGGGKIILKWILELTKCDDLDQDGVQLFAFVIPGIIKMIFQLRNRDFTEQSNTSHIFSEYHSVDLFVSLRY
jgi:hypothetical protein